MLKKVKLQDAVGTRLSHDITEIRPGEFKGPAFRRGHVISDEDLCRLRRLGKNSVYVIDLEEDEIHEDEAANTLARALAGPGVTWEDKPAEGKIKLLAATDGLLSVKVDALAGFNMHAEVSCGTLHNHSPVKKGEVVSAVRAIPLVMKRADMELAASLARQSGGVLSVKPLRQAVVGVVITGNEVYHGLIEDRFAPILTGKIDDLGSSVASCAYAPDEAEAISGEIRSCLASGCNMILLSAGMSVDPDDQTRQGIHLAGVDEIHYGTPVFPGVMFLVAYMGEVPLLGIPGCALHHRTTVLDLVLPRILAGERIGKTELSAMGHGGFCRDCPDCVYPRCPFGK